MCEYYTAYLHVDTGLGSTTPAVYTAWNIPSKFTLRVISLISTGATRFERSFLWTHRKLISTIFFSLEQREVDVNASTDSNNFSAPNAHDQLWVLTCHRRVYQQGWHWWSQQASYLRTLSLHNATAVTSQVDVKPWEGGKYFGKQLINQ